jgi:hypothetical protein
MPPRAASSRGTEECRALQALVEERKKYGIVASSSTEDALGRCGLPHGGGTEPLPLTSPYSARSTPTAPVTSGAAVGTETSKDDVRLNYMRASTLSPW